MIGDRIVGSASARAYRLGLALALLILPLLLCHSLPALAAGEATAKADPSTAAAPAVKPTQTVLTSNTVEGLSLIHI